MICGRSVESTVVFLNHECVSTFPVFLHNRSSTYFAHSIPLIVCSKIRGAGKKDTGRPAKLEDPVSEDELPL